MKLYPTECASPIATSPVCRYFALKATASANSPTAMHKDYYPGLNAIIIGGSTITATTEFNFYVPVKITATFTYAFIALVTSYASNPSVVKIFKLFGTPEDTPSQAY